MYQKIRRNDLIDQALKREIQEERKLPEETILLQTSYLNLLQQKILELNQGFDLVNFLMGDSDVETAIGIITPKQSLFLKCELVDTDHHGYNFQALYDAIYDFKITIIPIKNTHTWQELVMEDGNVAIQLTKFGDLYVWCPEEIDTFQFSSLQKINEQLKFIQTITPGLLHQVFLDIHAWVRVADRKEASIELEDATLDRLFDYYSNVFHRNTM